MYLFKNEKAYDKIKADQLVEEAIEMHKEYIASDEKYQEYLDKVDNDMIMNSKIKLAQMYEKEAQIYEKEARMYEGEANQLSEENKDLKLRLHEEKAVYNQSMKNMINQAIQFRFQEDISKWLDELNEEQLQIVQNNLYTVSSLLELKKML